MLVPLSHGYAAVVDEQDWDRIKGYHWKALETKPRSGRVYAIAQRKIQGRRTTFYMHRLIAGAAPGQQVDHADRDTLNNRRANLRLCTQSQNNANSVRKREAFKGVSWSKHAGRWKAEICINGRHEWLGYFTDATEAARTYDAALREHHGEFALTNFPA